MDGKPSTIGDLLRENIQRDLVLAVEEALDIGARRAYAAAKNMREGHLPNVLGQLRHFHMNECFADALAAVGANPTPLRGNAVVVGTAGIVRLGRFNLAQGVWNNARRSTSRRTMAIVNRAMEPLVAPELFAVEDEITAATAFFVAVFSGSPKIQPETPVAIQIAVPDSQMQGWLFREDISAFLGRYEESYEQEDLAKPVLRKPASKDDQASQS